MKRTKAVIKPALLSLIIATSAHAAVLTEYYNVQPVLGVPQPQVSFILGTDWTLALGPDALYAQNAGFLAGDNSSYRTIWGDGNNLLFKFVRANGDTNPYDVAVNLTGFNQWSGNGSPSIRLLWGTDAFGVNDNPLNNNGGVFFQGDSADLTQVASNTTDGSFTWDSLNVSTFHIAANQQSAYLMFLGSADSYGYVYSASADFTAVPEPGTVALTLVGVGLVALLRRRRTS